MNGRFLNIINSDKPVLVDFFAEWCGPCKQMSPVLKEVKSELKENIRIIKVDVDKNPMIATHYQINSIPTVIVLKKGNSKDKNQTTNLKSQKLNFKLQTSQTSCRSLEFKV